MSAAVCAMCAPAALGVALLAAGGGLWQVVPFAIGFAVLFALLCVHGVLVVRAPQRRRGRPRTAQVAGQACTVLPNAVGPFAAQTGLMACLTVLGGLAAVGTTRHGGTGAAVGWAVLALLPASFVADVVMGRLAVGYVALGPHGVHLRGRSFESFLPWDAAQQVLRLRADVPTVLVVVSATAADIAPATVTAFEEASDEEAWDEDDSWRYPDGAPQRRYTSLWKIDRIPDLVTIEVDTTISALPPALVLDTLAFYVEHPRHRTELGTPAAIARITHIYPNPI